MTKTGHPDFPIDEVADTAARVIALGGRIHQKWTCGHCGSRQTMAEPNVLYRTGKCEECGQVTSISECNYLVIRHMKGGE